MTRLLIRLSVHLLGRAQRTAAKDQRAGLDVVIIMLNELITE